MQFRGTFTASRSWFRGAIPSIIVMLLLSIMTTDAAWSPAIARHAPRHHASSKHHGARLAALTPEPFIRELASKFSRSKPSASACDPAKFRIVLDVGHTAESEGAISARNVAEFVFNRRLAQRIADKLKAEGFAEARLLVTEGKSRPSLFRRVAAANAWDADLFLSIHHDSVPNSMLEDWQFDGKKSRFSDRFSGYSVYVSRENPDFQTSLRFAGLIGKEMKAEGLQYARQYTLPIMGRNQHQLLNEDTGVYRYDQLVVLRKTQMPAVLLEAGSISNRDEELEMMSSERQELIAGGVTEAVKEFCDSRWAILGPL
jgi:N-acetylmuramoyl-L-alanine amidase